MTKLVGRFELPARLARVEESTTDTYAMFIAEPFESGFGHSIGNTLRRILLSGIEGTALTNVLIEGVQHEFQSMPGVIEDVTDIILNLKRVLLRSESREPAVLRIDVQGRDIVMAGDISCPEGMDVLNPELVICHLDNDRPFRATLHTRHGRGYVMADLNKREDAEPGEIALDSLFSPVKLVRYSVENTRVGQMTDFDRLTLEIFTDGRISPEDALAEAVAILRLHLNVFDHLDTEAIEFEHSSQVRSDDQNRLRKLLSMSVNEIELSVRAANCLNNANITTVGELTSKAESEMLKYRNFGKKSLNEIKQRLEELGLSLGMKVDEYLR